MSLHLLTTTLQCVIYFVVIYFINAKKGGLKESWFQLRLSSMYFKTSWIPLFNLHDLKMTYLHISIISDHNSFHGA